jgi:hypothetical protein
VDGCVYHSILGDYNKWIIMDFTRDNEADKECFEEIHKILVQSIGNNMAELVEINFYGAVNTNDSRADEVLCCEVYRKSSYITRRSWSE